MGIVYLLHNLLFIIYSFNLYLKYIDGSLVPKAKSKMVWKQIFGFLKETVDFELEFIPKLFFTVYKKLYIERENFKFYVKVDNI